MDATHRLRRWSEPHATKMYDTAIVHQTKGEIHEIRLTRIRSDPSSPSFSKSPVNEHNRYLYCNDMDLHSKHDLLV